jgi:cathepsin D
VSFQVLDAFNSAGLLTPYVFGMCMTPTTGSLEIGTIDPGKYSGSLTYLPFQTTGSLSGYYTVTMSSSKLGTANLLSSSANVIFDSGTTLIIGTTQWVNAFRAAAQNANAYAYASLFLGNMVQMSTAQINTWPVLTFTFPSTTGSYTVSLPPSMYIANQGGYGWLGVDLSGGQSFFIMGDIFLQALYVVYDNTNSRLGVAPVADCSHVMSSCTSSEHLYSSIFKKWLIIFA